MYALVYTVKSKVCNCHNKHTKIQKSVLIVTNKCAMHTSLFTVRDTPPLVVISKLNIFIKENQLPRGFYAHISWDSLLNEEKREQEDTTSKFDYIKGFG